MFTTEGSLELIIGEISFCECKFPQGKSADDFDIVIEVTKADDPAEHDWARLEWSENYGKGTMSTMKQKEISMRTLRGIGFEGDDLSALPALLTGKTVPGFSKKNDKGYMNIYLGSGSGNAPKDVLPADELKRRLSATFGVGADKAAETVGTAHAKPAGTTTTAKNPFARS
jgi:hypothetical protein